MDYNNEPLGDQTQMDPNAQQYGQNQPQQYGQPQQPYGQPPFMPNQQPSEKAGCWGLGFSFLFPIVGVILYFVKKDTVADAKNYLIWAGIGFAIGLVFNVITTMAS